MNARQAAFYRQAESDWSVFQHFHSSELRWWEKMQQVWCGLAGVRRVSFPVCHELHYLQMCTEKLAKAYFRTNPPKGHEAFRSFHRDLLLNPKCLASLGFASTSDLTRWQGSVKPIVDAIEDLAPSIADRKKLPNPEYPWPKSNPIIAPVDHSFTPDIFTHLTTQACSGEPPFLTILGRMVDTMQSAGWHL